MFSYTEVDLLREINASLSDVMVHVQRGVTGTHASTPWAGACKKQIPAKSKQSGKYTPVIPSYFLAQLAHVEPYLFHAGSLRFLEVGCGIGANLLLFKRWFHTKRDRVSVTGIDISETLLETAKSILPAEAVLHNVDAMDYNEYGSFDIIYFYRPFADIKKQRSLEAKLIRSAKEKSIIWSFDGFDNKSKSVRVSSVTRLPHGGAFLTIR